MANQPILPNLHPPTPRRLPSDQGQTIRSISHWFPLPLPPIIMEVENDL